MLGPVVGSSGIPSEYCISREEGKEEKEKRFGGKIFARSGLSRKLRGGENRGDQSITRARSKPERQKKKRGEGKKEDKRELGCLFTY